MSCQVCYEVYSSDSPDIIPRRLKCSHIVCSKCILNDLTYSTYYCPECYCLLDGSGIDEISEIISITDLPPLNTGHEDGITDDESQTNSDDLLKEDSVSNPKITIRGICSYPQCTNREIDNHLCIRHCRRKLDFTEVDRIAKDIKNATFNIKTTQTNTIESVARKELNPNDLIERFSQQKRIELGEAMDLIDRARDIMIREPNILYLEAPLLAVGDIHGQFYDLLNLIQEGGPPGTEEQYLFLGDYVDRGSFSCEVMFLLLSYKVAYPEKIWLLRGNHECATVSGHFGFKQECKMKYGVNVYYRFLLLFQTMPLAAVISTAYGDIFACHGGLSPTIKTLENIENLHRFVEPEADNSLLDILWSDPIPEENIEDMTDEEYETFMNIEWRPNPSRGCSYTYGYKAIREFLDRNNLVCIVRAHEVQEDGYKKHFDPVIVEARIKRLLQTRNINSSTGETREELSIDIGDTDFPPLLTIFSAPNYCDRYQNKAAILRIDIGLDGFHAIQYECVKHPEPEIVESQTDNYILAIISACPYMPTSLRNFVKLAVELGPDLDQSSMNPASPTSENDSSYPDDENAPLSPNYNRRRFSSRISDNNNNNNQDSKNEPEIPFKFRGNNRNVLTKGADIASFSYVINKTCTMGSDVIPPIDIVPTTQSPTIPFVSARPISITRVSDQGIERQTSNSQDMHETFIRALEEDVVNEKHPLNGQQEQLVPSHEIILEDHESLNIFKILTSALASIKKSVNSTENYYKTIHDKPSVHPIPLDIFSPKRSETPKQRSFGVDRMYKDVDLTPLLFSGSVSRSSDSKPRRRSLTEQIMTSTQMQNRNASEEVNIYRERINRTASYLSQMGSVPLKLDKKGNLFNVCATLNPSGQVILVAKGNRQEKQDTNGSDKLDNVSQNTTTSVASTPDTNMQQVRKRLSITRRDLTGVGASKSSNEITPTRQSVSSDSNDVRYSRPSRFSSGSHVGWRNSSRKNRSEPQNSSKFEEKEILGLKLMFSLFDRSGSNVITHEDLVAYGEETGDLSAIRDAGIALEIVDIDGDGKIGLVDFIRFATRLKARWAREQFRPLPLVKSFS